MGIEPPVYEILRCLRWINDRSVVRITPTGWVWPVVCVAVLESSRSACTS